ncbi:hypothetical protein SERLA73DRAFT_127992 [Serpula lacrymans var. lacrymans S7.3]|uniref:GED domain-containing protein n=2 Tax=Serpula lacrymans var. lacrymans TaxID=341189 RepID=F8QIR5_SERL3|nr:uncharacterized protein SERLADRAFT_367701 [Serpula lacrymans var. lacrymans S7.9]EGN91813.1 hypothetical protein SERLA73DRAFT_127992 [Serpula lacrymans var. lacrymans S7.3]EGO26069.1 hypothetical protein SERLADRAFT_367701 [Serpula lacrymans var. lacrymans S7.9]
MPGDAFNSYDAETIPSNGVGLSESRLSEDRRKLLDLVNRLHSTGVQIDMDLPMIAVIGSQSAGKSSLIESISGITLPRAAGTCTRCPTECRLSHSDEPWKCLVSLRFITGSNGQPLDQVRNKKFGPPITDKAEVEDRIRRAQRAILNPGKPFLDYLQGGLRATERTELSFSKNCVSLAISGPDVPDLSFCDLPGLIASVSQGGNAEKPSCLILSTVACETDFENQGAHQLAQAFDREGARTVGVLTKPDRMPSGEESGWLKFIENKRETLANGCAQELNHGLTWADARKQESEFFMKQPWSSLDSTYQGRLRTGNLTRCLRIQDDVYNLLKTTDAEIRELPEAPSTDSVGEVIRLVNQFLRALTRRLEGTPDANGLLQAIRPKQEQSKKALQATAPNFQLWSERDQSKNKNTLLPPDFLFIEEDKDTNEEPKVEDSSKKIYNDEVLKFAHNALTRELPDNYPFVVQKAYIQRFIEQWHGPSMSFFDSVRNILKDDLEKLVTEHFAKTGKGHLKKRVMSALSVIEHLDKCASKSQKHIEWLLEVEKPPLTLNVHYYSDYKDKFLSYYKGRRGRGTQILKSLISPQSLEKESSEAARSSINIALSELTKAGLDGVKAADFMKLCPMDPMEPALVIMAVAYKRFADMIPMAIDHDLVRGLETGPERILIKNLEATGTGGYERCQLLLEEQHSTRIRREELQKKRKRLNTAKDELRQLHTYGQGGTYP